jgi:hypothetical protein
MSHSRVHAKGETIRSADVDRSLELLRQSIELSPVVIARYLSGQITFANLSPELRNYLNSLSVSISPLTQNWIGASGQFNNFLLNATPISGSAIVLLNGIEQDAGDYALTTGIGTTIDFVTDVNVGDKVAVHYRSSNTVLPAVFANFGLNHYDVIQLLPTTNDMFVYGTSKGTGNPLEVAKYRAIDMAQVLTPITVRDAVDVTGAAPDYPPMVLVGGTEIWAAGYWDSLGPVSGGWQNRVSRFAISDLDLTPPSGYFEVTTDTAAQISDMVTDGTYVYAFMQGGTFIAPNHIAKVRISPTATVGVINSGLTVTGDTNMILSNNGWLYVAYQDPSVYQVRKYDTSPSNGLLKVHQFLSAPVRILAIDTNVYVLEGNNLQRIDDVTDEVDVLQIFGFVGSTMEFDGVDLWIGSGDTLYKCNTTGTILQTIVPLAGQTIKEIRSAFGFIWVAYEGNVSINITKVFPGLPGV